MNRIIVKTKVSTPLSGGQCRHNCPGGSRCNCNAAIYHKLHICHDQDCVCHSRERYDGQG